MALTVGEVMVRNVKTVSPGMRLPDLERMLLEERIGGAPVVDGGRLVGIVSRSDLVRQLALERSRAEQLSSYYVDPWDADEGRAEADDEVDEAIAARLGDLRVADVMVRDLIRVSPEETIEKAARMLLERRIHRLLVTQDGRLAGLLTSNDLVRLVAEGRLVPRG